VSDPTKTDSGIPSPIAGCSEERLLTSRRAVLGMSAGLFSWAFMPRFAEAASASDDPRLLIVVLRGGMDGINVAIPHGDKHYVSMRGNIAIPKASTIKLDSFFGLHPVMKNFGQFYADGDAAVVHATCTPLRIRSHFDGQDNVENGLPGQIVSNATGWLNRLLTALPAGAPIKSHGAIQVGDAPLILRGAAPVLGWSPTWFDAVEDPTLYMLRTLYRLRDKEMLDILERGLKANNLANKVGGGGDDDVSPVRKAFRGAGRLIAADDGPRIAVLSVGDWDTHADQGAAEGYLANVLAGLDAAIGDFKTAVGNAWGQTVMVLATEFGRTVRVNGDNGTDHGVGTVALLAGGAVNGGKVFADWPGLAPNQLYEDSDLKPTTDLRAVFKGVLKDHLGVPATLLNKTIFPESGNVAPLKNLVRGGGKSSSAIAALPLSATRAEPAIARYRKQHGLAPQI